MLVLDFCFDFNIAYAHGLFQVNTYEYEIMWDNEFQLSCNVICDWLDIVDVNCDAMEEIGFQFIIH